VTEITETGYPTQAACSSPLLQQYISTTAAAVPATQTQETALLVAVADALIVLYRYYVY
jgi:hypothetical protein